eukprot:1645660-Prymnesium_polylepis.1
MSRMGRTVWRGVGHDQSVGKEPDWPWAPLDEESAERNLFEKRWEATACNGSDGQFPSEFAELFSNGGWSERAEAFLRSVRCGARSAADIVLPASRGADPGDAWILGYFSDTSLV